MPARASINHPPGQTPTGGVHLSGSQASPVGKGRQLLLPTQTGPQSAWPRGHGRPHRRRAARTLVRGNLHAQVAAQSAEEG